MAEQVAQQAMTAGKQIEEAILLFNYGAVAEFAEFLRECGFRTTETDSQASDGLRQHLQLHNFVATPRRVDNVYTLSVWKSRMYSVHTKERQTHGTRTNH